MVFPLIFASDYGQNTTPCTTKLKPNRDELHTLLPTYNSKHIYAYNTYLGTVSIIAVLLKRCPVGDLHIPCTGQSVYCLGIVFNNSINHILQYIQ